MQEEIAMGNFKGIVKPVIITIMAIAMISSLPMSNCQTVFAMENKQGKTEYVTGKVYQFGEKGNYDLSSAEKPSSTVSGTESGGQFSINGKISSVTEKNGFPVYAVSGGRLKFSYIYDDSLLNASEDENHLVDDNDKSVNGIALASDIKKGALIIQTSKDGKIWFNVPGETYTNIFKDNPKGLKDLYTTTDVQMINGCYYRILVAYKTGIRTQKAQKFPPKIEKHEYKKYVEVYSFYAYDETAIEVPIPDGKKQSLGSTVRTKNEGYIENKDFTMDNDDPHFGWDIGKFYVGGFTDYEDDAYGNPIFLKNNGDRLSLWFDLMWDIDKCYGNSAIKVVADPKGSDAEFGVPGGPKETTDFGRGALIIRKTNPDKTKDDPQIYTNYLEASASVDAATKVDLLEEGDYEVALDYAVQFDKTKILGRSILPETAKYRVSFKFSVRNGNSMIFLFDKETGSELSSGSITESGFRIDFANSKYLRVKVKREILKDGFDGLTEDTRFNSVAADGDEFTDEGVYTLTITNRDIENVDPTVKRVYVGTDNILKAYVVNNVPISEIKEMVALGATIADDGTIIAPEPEQDSAVETSTEEKTAESDVAHEATVSQDTEESVTDYSLQEDSEANSEHMESVTEKPSRRDGGFPIIPISVAVVAAAAGGAFFMSRRKK